MTASMTGMGAQGSQRPARQSGAAAFVASALGPKLDIDPNASSSPRPLRAACPRHGRKDKGRSRPGAARRKLFERLTAKSQRLRVCSTATGTHSPTMVPVAVPCHTRQ